MTEVLLNLHEENPDLRDDLGKAMETVLKDCGGFPDQIRQLMDDVMEQLPEIERPMSPRLAAELERLKAEDDAREAAKRAGGGPGRSVATTIKSSKNLIRSPPANLERLDVSEGRIQSLKKALHCHTRNNRTQECHPLPSV